MSGYVRDMAEKARKAQHAIAALDGAQRRALIELMAAKLDEDCAGILAANDEDMTRARENGVKGAMLDRLKLDEARVAAIANALREVAGQEDPVGQVTRSQTNENGLVIERQRLPLGLVSMIYEARPNVTADAAALCLKAGNAVLLRGGSEARSSNVAIAASLHAALREMGLPEAAVSLITDTAREHIMELIQLSDLIDLVIPRGGEGLIRFVADNARVPVIKHYKGVCHLYVDSAANPAKAIDLAVDGKTSRPGVCNALEGILVHQDLVDTLLPKLVSTLQSKGVEVRGCPRTVAAAGGVVPAGEADHGAEFLDLVVSMQIVDDLDAALVQIDLHGSDHTEVIVTEDPAAAEAFVRGTRSSAVMVNASSRFNDGGALGLGAEIGISTTRLHAYGPMGVESLTIERYVVRGDGQVRHPESRVA